MSAKLIFIKTISLLLIGHSLLGQFSISTDVMMMAGLPTSDLEIGNRKVEDYHAYGLNAHLNLEQGLIKDIIWLNIALGGELMYFGGEYDPLEFRGNASRLQLNALLNTALSTFWRAGIGAGIENNRDFKDFRNQSYDNFRTNFLAEIQYFVSDRVSLRAMYTQALNCKEDFYLLKNPEYKFSLGLNFYLLKG